MNSKNEATVPVSLDIPASIWYKLGHESNKTGTTKKTYIIKILNEVLKG